MLRCAFDVFLPFGQAGKIDRCSCFGKRAAIKRLGRWSWSKRARYQDSAQNSYLFLQHMGLRLPVTYSSNRRRMVSIKLPPWGHEKEGSGHEKEGSELTIDTATGAKRRQLPTSN